MKTLADAVRIDRWLWAARFFKTRSLAARAVAAGHVTVFGQHVKPAKMVQPGDLLGIRVGLAVYGVRVLALALTVLNMIKETKRLALSSKTE